MVEVTLRLQDPQMPIAARCRQRYETVLQAKRECEAAAWCGGISRDSGIACANGRDPHRFRFELRTGEIEGTQRLSDGSHVVSHLLQRSSGGDACLRFRREQARITAAGVGAARRHHPNPRGKIAAAPSAAELRVTRLAMAAAIEAGADPLAARLTEALALAQTMPARGGGGGGSGSGGGSGGEAYDDASPLVSVGSLRRLATHTFDGCGNG